MGLGGSALRLPPLRRAAGRPPRQGAGAALALARHLPLSTGTWCAAASWTNSSPRTPSTPGPRCSRATRRSTRWSSAASSRRRPCATRAQRSIGDPGHVTSSSPTAPTAASAGRSARCAPASGRTARRSARTGSRRATPSRGSRAPSTSRTATATRCPATGGSSRSATAPSTSASGCCPRSVTSRASTPSHLLTEYAHMVADRWEIDPGAMTMKADERAPPDGRLGRPEGRPHVPRRRRRRRQRQPVQRRGHRLRLRDRADGRRRARTRRSSGNDAAALQRYPTMLDAEYGQYFKVARLFARGDRPARC